MKHNEVYIQCINHSALSLFSGESQKYQCIKSWASYLLECKTNKLRELKSHKVK